MSLGTGWAAKGPPSSVDSGNLAASRAVYRELRIRTLSWMVLLPLMIGPVLLGAVLMLVHIDQPEAAASVHNAWLRTLEEGVHTYDIYTEGISKPDRQIFHRALDRLNADPAPVE